MASIIAMRPLPAWMLFAAGIAVPVIMLEVAAAQTAESITRGGREQLVTERARIAQEIRRAFEDANGRGKTTLSEIPGDATETEALAALAAKPNPFAVGIVLTTDRRLLVAAGSVAPPDAELTRGEDSLRVLADAVPPGHGSDVSSFNVKPTGDYVTARRLASGVTVGWLTDDAMIERGAAPHLTHDLVLERASDEAKPTVNDDRKVGLNINIQVTVRSEDSRADGKAAQAPSTEDLTLITLAETHRYRVVLSASEREKLDNVLVRVRQSIFGFVSACLVGLVLFAASLFHRARKAQALADLRTDFVAAVSLELRTPLASVRMFAELLEAGDVPEDERAEVEHALAGETRRLHATLDRMLRFGSLARGKLEPQKTKQVLAPILEEAAARAKTAAQVEVDPALEANVDAGLVGLALDNLLSNAKKYAPEGGPYVVRGRADRKWVYVDVVDRGPGIGWRARRLIWKPFERADARLSKATEGTGVGLALVRGIARAHGGDATVTSKRGDGATFTLRLPRR